MPKVSVLMASVSRESVFGVQTSTARKIIGQAHRGPVVHAKRMLRTEGNPLPALRLHTGAFPARAGAASADARLKDASSTRSAGPVRGRRRRDPRWNR